MNGIVSLRCSASEARSSRSSQRCKRDHVAIDAIEQILRGAALEIETARARVREQRVDTIRVCERLETVADRAGGARRKIAQLEADRGRRNERGDEQTACVSPRSR